MIPFPKRTRAFFRIVVVIHEDFLINRDRFVCNLSVAMEFKFNR